MFPYLFTRIPKWSLDRHPVRVKGASTGWARGRPPVSRPTATAAPDRRPWSARCRRRGRWGRGRTCRDTGLRRPVAACDCRGGGGGTPGTTPPRPQPPGRGSCPGVRCPHRRVEEQLGRVREGLLEGVAVAPRGVGRRPPVSAAEHPGRILGDPAHDDPPRVLGDQPVGPPPYQPAVVAADADADTGQPVLREEVRGDTRAQSATRQRRTTSPDAVSQVPSPRARGSWEAVPG